MSDVLLARIIHVIWSIWYCRNKSRFEGKKSHLRSVYATVSASVSMCGNLSKHHMHSSIEEFSILKAFAITCHPRKAPRVIEVDCLPPPCGWIKANTDGAAKGSPGHATGGGIFRDRSGAVLGCFAAYYGISWSLYAELLAAMTSIEIAHQRGWSKLWLECNSSLVVQAFSNVDLVPLRLRNKWRNCLCLVSNMIFRVSHIYREVNACADKLASFGVVSRCFTWWDLVPNFIRDEFFRNRFNLPSYKFS